MIVRWTLLGSSYHALPQHGGPLRTWGWMQSSALLTCLHRQRNALKSHVLLTLLMTLVIYTILPGEQSVSVNVHAA